MPEKFDPSDMDVLLSADRRTYLDVHGLLSVLPVRTHHVVADIGCGPGYLTVPIGKYLFDGKLYAIDIQQEMLDATKQELERVRLTNVEPVLSPEESIPLEDDSLDGAFSAFVVHEADDPKQMLNETLRCLRRGGWLALLEWHKRKMDEGPPVKERIEEAALREMALKVGFRFTSRHGLNENQYMLLMRK